VLQVLTFAHTDVLMIGSIGPRVYT